MKTVTATAGPIDNRLSTTVQLNNASDNERLTPALARAAATVAYGNTIGVTVTDGRDTYRLTASGCRKIKTDTAEMFGDTFGYYEDNGGGLFAFVFDADGNVVAGVGDLEYTAVSNPGEWEQVKAGMLANPLAEVNGWDGHLDGPQAVYDEMTATEFGWSLVASEKGLYPYRMGAAAKDYFGIDTDANTYDDLVAHS